MPLEQHPQPSKTFYFYVGPIFILNFCICAFSLFDQPWKNFVYFISFLQRSYFWFWWLSLTLNVFLSSLFAFVLVFYFLWIYSLNGNNGKLSQALRRSLFHPYFGPDSLAGCEIFVVKILQRLFHCLPASITLGEVGWHNCHSFIDDLYFFFSGF